MTIILIILAFLLGLLIGFYVCVLLTLHEIKEITRNHYIFENRLQSTEFFK